MRIKILLTFMIVVGVLCFFSKPQVTVLDKAPSIKVMVNDQEVLYQLGVLPWNNQYMIRGESTTTMLMNRKVVPMVVSMKDKIYVDFGQYPPEKLELLMAYFLTSDGPEEKFLSDEDYKKLIELPNEERHYRVKRLLVGTIEELDQGKYVISYKPELAEVGIQQIAVVGYWDGDRNKAEYSFFVRVVE